MGKILKAAVIGTGFIGPVHIEAARRTAKAEVAALVEKNPEVAKEQAAVLNIPRFYTDYKEMLLQPDIDVVHICSPNIFHYQMAKDALLAGKHVVCEKPMTITSAEGLELVKLAAEKGLVNAVHFNNRYYPLVRHAKHLVNMGSSGKILSVTGSYLQDWLLYDTDYSWRLNSKSGGPTRAVGDIGSHWLDLAQYVTGLSVKEVNADFATFHTTRKRHKQEMSTWSVSMSDPSEYEEIPIDTEDYATVMLRFEDGVKGVFTVSQMAAGHRNNIRFEVNGSKSSVIWDSDKANMLDIGRRDKGNEVIVRDPYLLHEDARAITSYPGGHSEGFADTTKHFLNEVYGYILSGKTGTPKFPAFTDGYQGVVLCEAIAKSVKTGAWVKVEY